MCAGIDAWSFGKYESVESGAAMRFAAALCANALCANALWMHRVVTRRARSIVLVLALVALKLLVSLGLTLR